jgi:Alcohol dehydrogenase GroES-like domain/Domain of unknown function(DUF2779)
MKAIRVHEFGAPEVLKLEEVPTPKPAAGQVLVRIHAAGVNPYETYMRAGTYPLKPPLPYTPGSDGAGTVEAVGEGVKKVKPKDRVYTGRTISGSYAEYALALEEQVHLLPAKIEFKQGAGIWVPYGTAYHALYHSAKAQACETVLVHGAIVYSPFEASVLRDLAEFLPGLASSFFALLERICDLLPVVRTNVAHPGFLGSYSIKSTAPALVPGFNYDDLDEVAGGDDASAVFFRLASDRSLSDLHRGRYRRALLTYCSRDTLALLYVHRRLRELSLSCDQPNRWRAILLTE